MYTSYWLHFFKIFVWPQVHCLFSLTARFLFTLSLTLGVFILEFSCSLQSVLLDWLGKPLSSSFLWPPASSERRFRFLIVLWELEPAPLVPEAPFPPCPPLLWCLQVSFSRPSVINLFLLFSPNTSYPVPSLFFQSKASFFLCWNFSSLLSSHDP